MRDPIEAKVVQIVAEQLATDPTEITMQSAFIADLGADSLDMVEIAMTIEEEFDMMLPADAPEQFITVGQAVEHLQHAHDSV